MQRRTRWVVPVCALIVVLGGLLCLGSEDATPIAPAMPSRNSAAPPPSSSRAPAPAHEAPETLDACPEAREALAARVQKVKDACDLDRIALDCPAPLPFPAAFADTVPSYFAARQTALASCPGLVPEEVVVDCDAFPCLLALTTRARESLAACGVSGPGPLQTPEERVWTGWTVHPFFETPAESTYPGAAIHTSMPSRLRALGARIGTGSPMEDGSALGDCDRVERLGAMTDCQAALEVQGCVTDKPVAVPRALIEAELEAADALAARLADCPEAAVIDWFLDCSDLPCVLAATRASLDASGVRFNRAFCESVTTEGVWIVGDEGYADPVWATPIFGAEPGTAAFDVLLARWEARGVARNHALRTWTSD